MFVFRMFKKCQEKWKSIKNKICEKILETRADFGSISVENGNFRGENVAKRGKNVKKLNKTLRILTKPNFCQWDYFVLSI